MSSITDILYADSKELSVLVGKYPNCHLSKLDWYVCKQRYLVVIPDEPEDCYFNFLIDNALALASLNLSRRFYNDAKLARAVRARITDKGPDYGADVEFEPDKEGRKGG